MLPDGRVGFIDFGIVGRVSPATWAGLEALLASLATGDYVTMAKALGTIGACDEEVDYNAFARDLEAFFVELDQVNSSLVLTADPTGGEGGRGASVRERSINRGKEGNGGGDCCGGGNEYWDDSGMDEGRGQC